MTVVRWTTRAAAALGLAVGLSTLGGCIPLLYDDRCGAEHRALSARARLSGADGAHLADATVELIEQRPEGPRERVFAVVMGPGYGSRGGPLRDRVARARLVDAADTGTVLVELPTGPAPLNGDEVFGASDAAYAGPLPFAEVKRRVAAGRAVLELRTSVPGRETVRAPLVGPRQSDWGRASCS